MPVTHLRSVVGGDFQDAMGNPLVRGYVTFRLSTDAMTQNNLQIDAGRVVTVTLDNTGNADGTSNIWANDYMTPTDTVYRIKAYSAAGQQAWESENVIPSGAATFDLGSLVPLIY